MGWATYFAFIFAAVNTLTVTYFLAIERYPFLTTIFPSFLQYIVIIVSIGIPILVIVGYIHYKRTLAFKSEADVMVESNPYQRRNVVNNTISVEVAVKNMELLIKLTKQEKITEEEMNDLTKLYERYSEFLKERKFSDNNDMEFLKGRIRNS
jgi:hypothetical protein|tara:strand:+ start:266 stop:721 length:456 start_codon:yes stop_codon:yes gene_type:complete